ncbi:hypothetical protein [Corynebacterium kroppenstedtii]|uniref:hypothetical protein n=1 Tax=Corynebacterium kroppenstedtii TaxID=161879 RepID=UPI00268648A2|nr:hypothetical protein [Corynebacterium kroppenstedtii]
MSKKDSFILHYPILRSPSTDPSPRSVPLWVAQESAYSNSWRPVSAEERRRLGGMVDGATDEAEKWQTKLQFARNRAAIDALLYIATRDNRRVASGEVTGRKPCAGCIRSVPANPAHHTLTPRLTPVPPTTTAWCNTFTASVGTQFPVLS